MGGRGASAGTGRKGNRTSEEDTDVLEWYVSGEGMWVNNALRGLNPDITESDMTEQEKGFVKTLERMTNSEDVGNTTLYRTVDAKALFPNITDMEYQALVDNVIHNDTQKLKVSEAQKAMNKLKDTFTDKSFMSTSKDESIAEDLSYYFGSEKPILLEIKTKKGTKGIDVMKHANARMKEVEADDPQKEVLLARNQSFKVDKKITKSKNGYLKVTIYR